MRTLVFAFIAAVAGLMGYLWLQPACPGGSIVIDEARCRATPGFDAGFCHEAFGRAPAIARVSGPSYQQRSDCDNAWPLCVDHANGWGPKPSSWCLVREGTGPATKIVPQYDSRRG